jgi:hypothetical protein
MAGCGKTENSDISGAARLKEVDKVTEEGDAAIEETDKITEAANKVMEAADKVMGEEETEISEEDLFDKVYDKYYSPWSEDEMITAINERNQYRESCSFYNEVVDYMENVREVRDISNMIEPLYYTDMKYYESQDFEKDPLLIIHLAKNEIYARHGYIFKDEDLNNYFMVQLWYEPFYMPEDFNDSVFNDYEKANLKLLAELDTYKE